MLTAMTLLLGLIGYALLCWAKPLASCHRCHGLGTSSGSGWLDKGVAERHSG